MKLTLTSKVDRQSKPYGGEEEGSVASRFSALKTGRDPYLQRARDCSKVTIPSLIPDEGPGDRGRLKTPYQSLGARGVNYLASKLLITLFPPNTSFFKLEIDDLAIRLEEGGPGFKTDLDIALVRVERAVMKFLETANGRASLHEAFKHLLVGGNVLLYVGDDGIRVYHLNRYVLCRDPNGNVTEIVVEEEVYPDALPPGFLDGMDMDSDEQSKSSDKTLRVYTYVEFEDGECHWWQEVMG
ncbi:phage tail protein, partial [bacterium]|nr:phage tail protein [bacterium]